MEGKLLPIKAFSLDVYKGETPKKRKNAPHQSDARPDNNSCWIGYFL
jgi:hypothetical protein